MKDIIDEFVFQLYAVCKWRAATTEAIREGLNESMWNVEKSEAVLKSLYGGLTEDGKLEFIEECTSRDLFEYYGLIGHFRVKVLLGQYP